jgi:7-cyano-7-deazaguanine synthase
VGKTLAVVVLSGGLDSATCLAVAVDRHGAENVRTVSFDYGQKHKIELDCARNLAAYYSIANHTVITLNPLLFVGGVLTTDENVPDMTYDDLPSGTMSPTYVPFRNANLLSQATAFADSLLRETVKFLDSDYIREVPANPWEDALVYAGMHSEDAAGFAYADCTPEFLGAMAAAIYIGTYHKVRLQAIFQHAQKWEIILEGNRLDVPYEMTHSCYRGERPACGHCSTCHARIAAFEIAGIPDPIEYASEV